MSKHILVKMHARYFSPHTEERRQETIKKEIEESIKADEDYFLPKVPQKYEHGALEKVK